VPRRPPPPVDDATARARYREHYARWKAASTANQWPLARREAEQAIVYARGNPEPRVLAATSSCKLGDEARARLHLRKLPRSAGMHRIAVAIACRRAGIELEDLLTEDEARAAR